MSKKILDGLTPQQRYDKKNMKRIAFAFNTKTEQHILNHLQKQPNKSRYIKDLIEADMKK